MIDILRQIAVVLGALAFLAICWWAFSPKRKKRFEEDAKLPFADEEPSTDEARGDKDESGDKSGAKQKQGQDK
ncbi:CcoQ/FixQ family Cbb3-type cytochrome c oxidase assembly chaperone [Microbulbifer thermotolerans]|uniref:CcoQ/FixQ family Cbb3-type cytochrome c oxidase assembly chaperone n=1 Tax=Microbulbifer thermotolerans TaxID=252514 RepID=A0A143HNG7_MICTH|nr:CcoQ/FixQ family Cbb3-type cytochrome c oxidase assembly chaperone [Microbulbifer thermotolerans]AMX03037.1 cytochrome C oxidase Cbb3 [Microbulbifer thermotolerans]MCX2778998.1 CcoQ/FixQ family Cbb3-type cytochrome c oxidase assembly chaperone [Microbulbifer thermotolerans]MCX2781491.1 CcoQ/FixQ family Cbb3-type cytochrome c oxidase assembly chaperone [Microbulbifer thermotolerans]MCX2795730.1 CcoQ/FixQ family Cbb3-type cytochrome c oxidase assembly chaperone [Microbulbifer thermotolerans]M